VAEHPGSDLLGDDTGVQRRWALGADPADVEAIEAIPYRLARRRDLNTAQRRERAAAFAALTPEQRRLFYRAAGEDGVVLHRHVRDQRDRVALGLPATRAEETGRDDGFLPLELERHWIEQGQRAGLIDPDWIPFRQRRAAKQLAEAALSVTERPAGGRTPQSVSIYVTIAFWEAEAARWMERVQRDLASAQTHREYARQAERELVEARKAAYDFEGLKR
jgi:hypothetical protein